METQRMGMRQYGGCRVTWDGQGGLCNVCRDDDQSMARGNWDEDPGLGRLRKHGVERQDMQGSGHVCLSLPHLADVYPLQGP